MNDDGILDPNTEIQVRKDSFGDANDYYPFGLRMAGENSLVASPGNEYLYNGKELQDELGLGWYDYGFRFYDPAVGRFVSVDPLAESFPELTTYQYASNTPIVAIDLDGLEKFVIHLLPVNEIGGQKIDQNSADFKAYKMTLSIQSPNGGEKVVTTSEPLLAFENKSQQEGDKRANALQEGETYNLEVKGFTSPSGYEFSDDVSIHIESKGQGHSDKTYLHPIGTSGQGYLAGCKGICSENKATIGEGGEHLFAAGEFNREKKDIEGSEDRKNWINSWNSSYKLTKEVVSKYRYAVKKGMLQKENNFQLSVGTEAKNTEAATRKRTANEREKDY